MAASALLGTALPLIQAPMAGAQDHRMALAVCRAGGLGSLPCAMLAPEALQKELAALRDGTDAPFNLNFFCHTPTTADVVAQARWAAALNRYYAQWRLGADATAPAVNRAPFSAAIADLVEPFLPAIVSFHFGLPEPRLLARVQSWGSKVLASATTVDEALWLQDRGVDAIIAQGLEAGGHRGMFLTEDLGSQSGLFTLLPQIVDAVRVPVVAAGGIADARGVAAAMALGATAVQVGTAYLCTDEATTSALHRQALQSTSARHTVLTNVFTGRPARGIVNRAIRELGPFHPDAPAFPGAATAMAPLRAAAEQAGFSDFTPLWCGQNASQCRQVSAAEITQELARGFGT